MPLSCSVIIPTYSPHLDTLNTVLDALKGQTLTKDNWELILIDNATPDATHIQQFDLTWHANARSVREEQLGLTYARLRGIREACGQLIFFIDDDNKLHRSYLERGVDLFAQHDNLGAIGGKALPIFHAPPPDWIDEFYGYLALRDLGESEMVSEKLTDPRSLQSYPDYAPIGAGMVLHSDAAKLYAKMCDKADNLLTDRCGTQLSSSGDNDIILTIMKGGWKVGYSPNLILEHLIPDQRLTRKYLAEMAYSTSRSWVEVLIKHDILPWDRIPAWSVPLRKLRSFFRYKAWQDAPSYIRWRASCGLFNSLAL